MSDEKESHDEIAKRALRAVIDKDPIYRSGRDIYEAAKKEAVALMGPTTSAVDIQSLAVAVLGSAIICAACDDPDPTSMLDVVSDMLRKTPFGNRDIAT